MSVRVNLLPQEIAERQAAARQRGALVLGGVGLLAVLAAVTLWQESRISGAEERRDDAQAVLSALSAEEAQLSEFSDLERRVRDADEQIRTAFENEVSLAGVLQDIAAVMPSDAQLDSLNVTVSTDAPTAATEALSLGTLQAVGRSLNDHAPGVERLLLELDKVAAFHDLFFSSSVLQDVDEPYPTFTVEAQLGPEILTGRYDEGIPEGLR